MDRWALRSQQRFAAAQAAGKFEHEIIAVELTGRKCPTMFETDERNRPETTLTALAMLKPAFRADGTITAGNAPSLNSGAAAVVLADQDFAESRGLDPAPRLVSYGIAAVEPGLFGLGPIPAVRQALDRAGWKLGDVDRVEINEAFAAIAIVVMRKLGLPEGIVNVEGGAIAWPSDWSNRRCSNDPPHPLDASRRSPAWYRHFVHRRRSRHRARTGDPLLAATLAVRLRPVSHKDDMHLISDFWRAKLSVVCGLLDGTPGSTADIRAARTEDPHEHVDPVSYRAAGVVHRRRHRSSAGPWVAKQSRRRRSTCRPEHEGGPRGQCRREPRPLPRRAAAVPPRLWSAGQASRPRGPGNLAQP
jgi:Thiolase, N-terminal domain/Thiolase, C-terminal domain